MQEDSRVITCLHYSLHYTHVHLCFLHFIRSTQLWISALSMVWVWGSEGAAPAALCFVSRQDEALRPHLVCHGLSFEGYKGPEEKQQHLSGMVSARLSSGPLDFRSSHEKTNGPRRLNLKHIFNLFLYVKTLDTDPSLGCAWWWCCRLSAGQEVPYECMWRGRWWCSRRMGVCLNPSLICSLLSLSLGFKCPVCSKSVASNEMEVHFIMCLSKPRLSYNGKRGFSLLYMTGVNCCSGTGKEKPLNWLWLFVRLGRCSPPYLLVLPILCQASCRCAAKYS